MDNYVARLTLTKDQGVTQVEIMPTSGTEHDLAQPYLLEGARAAKLLEDIQARTAQLDTRMEIQGNRGVIQIGS